MFLLTGVRRGAAARSTTRADPGEFSGMGLGLLCPQDVLGSGTALVSSCFPFPCPKGQAGRGPRPRFLQVPTDLGKIRAVQGPRQPHRDAQTRCSEEVAPKHVGCTKTTGVVIDRNSIF